MQNCREKTLDPSDVSSNFFEVCGRNMVMYGKPVDKKGPRNKH